MKTQISVVIPTSGRSSTLPKAVKSLFIQSFSKAGYEIIVVYSKTDKEVLKRLARQSPVRSVSLAQRPPGTMEFQ